MLFWISVFLTAICIPLAVLAFNGGHYMACFTFIMNAIACGCNVYTFHSMRRNQATIDRMKANIARRR